jgi:hypothetical protein
LRPIDRGAIVAAMRRPRRPGFLIPLPTPGRGASPSNPGEAGDADQRSASAVFFAPTLLAALCLASVGCGHPASKEECEVIFRRSAEIELRAQNISDPKVIEERTGSVREARGKELIDRCVGRRITDSALACVRQATAPEQVDRCLE